MSIFDIKVPEITRDVMGTPLTLRGLCFDDVLAILQQDPVGLARIVEQVVAGGLPEEVAAAHLPAVAASAPALPAIVIACAAGSPSIEAANAVRAWPMPVQMEVLLDVLRLSFEPVGGIKKFAAQFLSGLEAEGIQIPTRDLIEAIRSSTGSTH